MEKEVETKTEEVKTEETKSTKKSKKGLLITLIVICSLLLAGLISCLVIIFVKPDFLHGFGEKKITITFDSDGGSKVESITYVKGDYVKLPIPTKEGYEFVGWFIEKVNDNWEEYFKKDVELTDYWTKILSDDITVKAKWEELKEDEMIMTINFDAKGGKVSGNNFNDSQSVVKCKDNAYTVEGLPSASKDGYRFMAWTDKNGTPILNGALLTCSETLDLYATWEKKEETKPTTPVAEKTPKCPSGYELKDNSKCALIESAEKYCTDGWKLIDGECVNPSSPNPKGTRTCPQKTYNGWTGTGTYYEAGAGYCGYYELSSYIGQRDNCRNNGGTLAANNHCYKYTEINNYVVTCAADEKKFASQVIAPGNGGGCYQVKAASKKCKDGYSSTSAYGECVKIVDPTYE